MKCGDCCDTFGGVLPYIWWLKCFFDKEGNAGAEWVGGTASLKTAKLPSLLFGSV